MAANAQSFKVATEGVFSVIRSVLLFLGCHVHYLKTNKNAMQAKNAKNA
jgi:hypothetical protein